MRQRHTERFCDDLRRRGGAEELASTARRSARAASHRRRVVEADQIVREARTETLNLSGVFGIARWKCHAARHDDAGQLLAAGQREHRCGQSLVAGCDAEHARRSRQRSDQPPHDDRRVVAIGQAVEHAGRALRSPVARIAAVDGERDGARRAQRLRRTAHQQSDLPVPGVVAEGDRLALLGAHATHGADDHVLRSAERVRAPAHAGVLREAEDVAARLVAQHLRGQRQTSLGPSAFEARCVDHRGGTEHVLERRCSPACHADLTLPFGSGTAASEDQWI